MFLVKKSTMGQEEKLLIDYTEKVRSGVLRCFKQLYGISQSS